jgi:hypothetical protein
MAVQDGWPVVVTSMTANFRAYLLAFATLVAEIEAEENGGDRFWRQKRPSKPDTNDGSVHRVPTGQRNCTGFHRHLGSPATIASQTLLSDQGGLATKPRGASKFRLSVWSKPTPATPSTFASGSDLLASFSRAEHDLELTYGTPPQGRTRPSLTSTIECPGDCDDVPVWKRVARCTADTTERAGVRIRLCGPAMLLAA